MSVEILAQPIAERGLQFTEGMPREDLDQAEEIDEDAEKGMGFVPKASFRFVAAEVVVTLEVAFLHDAGKELLCPAMARSFIKRHLVIGQAEMLHHQATKGLPREHQMHGGEPALQFVEVELPMVGMECHGHIGELAQPHACGQEMVPRDRKSTRLNSSHDVASRMPSSA